MAFESTTSTLAELCRQAGVTARTVRYYIAEGLLPPPISVGPAAAYTEGHLDRLRLIRRLQQSRLSLGEIRARLATLNDAEIRALVAAPAPAPPESAAEYVRAVLGGGLDPVVRTPERASFVPASRSTATPARPTAAPMPARFVAQPSPVPRRFAEGSAPFNAAVAPAQAPPPSLAQAAPIATAVGPVPAVQAGDSRWDRLILADGVELHVRQAPAPANQSLVDRVTAAARHFLGEDQS